MLENYQTAAEIIVLLVYAVVVITALVGAVAGLRLFFKNRNAGELSNDDDDSPDI